MPAALEPLVAGAEEPAIGPLGSPADACDDEAGAAPGVTSTDDGPASGAEVSAAASTGDEGAAGDAGAGSAGESEPMEPAELAVPLGPDGAADGAAALVDGLLLPADGALVDGLVPPLDTPAPTGVDAGTFNTAPQSSQYSAPAGFSF